MKRKIFLVTVILIIGVLIFSSAAMGAGSTAKNIRAYFSGIKIIVNGKQQASTPEPFIYNDTTYVPIRLVSTALGKNVNWDQQQKAVIITDGPSDQQTLAELAQLRSQLAQKEAELAQLRQQNSYYIGQITELKKQVTELEQRKNVAADFEDYLEDEYSRWNKMDFEFDVDGDEDEIELTIEIDLADFASRWRNTDEDDIEDWLNEIFEYVEDEYPDADFYGTIEDIDKDETLVEFEVYRGKLKVEFISRMVDEADVEDELNDEFGYDLDSYHRDFGNMEAYISLSVDEDYEEAFVEIEVDLYYYEDEWLAICDTSAAEYWIEDIVYCILDYYEDYDVIGQVINEENEIMMEFEYEARRDKFYFDWDFKY